MALYMQHYSSHATCRHAAKPSLIKLLHRPNYYKGNALTELQYMSVTVILYIYNSSVDSSRKCFASSYYLSTCMICRLKIKRRTRKHTKTRYT